MTSEMKTFYKLARPDGWDFYTGKTINYRESLGQDVSPPCSGPAELCSSFVIHASRNPNDCFIGAEIPCSAYEVAGVPVVDTQEKSGFTVLHVVREIEDLDALFGWRYSEVCDPVHPFRITPPEITPDVLDIVRAWDSVWASVGASVWASVRDSVRASVWAYVWDSVRASVWDSVWAYTSSFSS